MLRERDTGRQSEGARRFLGAKLAAAAILGIVAFGCESEPTVRIERFDSGCLVSEDVRPANFLPFLFPEKYLAHLELDGLGRRRVVTDRQEILRPNGRPNEGKRVVVVAKATEKWRNIVNEMTPEELALEIEEELSRFLESREEYPLGEGSLTTDKVRIQRFGTVEITLEIGDKNCIP